MASNVENTTGGGPARESSRRDSRPPVPLYKRSSSHFQVADRERGEDYFHEGRVAIRVEGPRARAKVKGSDKAPYNVGLDWSKVPDSRALHAFCDCPRFSGRKPCKHVWAALLALAESDGDHQPTGTDRLSLRTDNVSKWPELGAVHRHGDNGASSSRTRRESSSS